MPDHAGLHGLPTAPMDDDVIDPTAQQGLPRWLRQDRGGPYTGEHTPHSQEGRPQLRRQREGWVGLVPMLVISGLRCRELTPRGFPAPRQCRRHHAMVGIDTAKWAFRQRRRIPQPFALLPLGFIDTRCLLPLYGQRLGRHSERAGRQGLEARRDDPGLDRIGRHILTDRHTVWLPHVVTEGRRATCRLHHHVVPAGPAIDQALQQGLAGPGHATGGVASIVGGVVGAHRLDRFAGLPAAGGWVLVVHAKAPLRPGQTRGGRAAWRMAVAHRVRPAIGAGPRVGWVLQDGEHRGPGGACPHHVPKAIAPREAEAVGIETFPHLAGRSTLQKRRQDHHETGLDLPIGRVAHLALGIAFKPCGQGPRQVAPRGLMQEPGSHTVADGLELPCGQGALQPEEQPAVGCGRIIQAIHSRHHATLIAAESNRGYPSEPLRDRRVASEARMMPTWPHVTCPTNAFKPSRCEVLAALWPTSVSTTSMASGGQPSARARAVRAYWSRRLSWWLKAWWGGRLPNGEHGLAGQMLGCDDVGAVHRSPPGRWPRVRRGCGPGGLG